MRPAEITRVRPIWVDCLAIFALSFLLRVALIAWTGQFRTSEIPEPVNIALSIVRDGVFGNPYRVPTGPTAHTTPFVPYLLSLGYKAFGMGTMAQLFQALMSTFACSLQYALLPLFAIRVGWPAKIGTWAGLFGALFPFRFWLETKGTFEHTYAGLALVLIGITTAASWRSQRPSLRSAVGRGFLWAIAFHISASLLPACLLLFMVEAARSQERKFSQRAAYISTMCITILLLLLPWTARNYLRFGKLFYMRNNLGLELAVSNRDYASPQIDENMHSQFYRHPHGSTAEALKVQQEGEIAYNAERMTEARTWIRTHPRLFVWLTLRRVWYFWFPPMQRTWQTLSYVLLTITGLCGGWLAVRRKEMAAWFVLPLWAAYPTIYYLIQTSVRYRYPIDWSLTMFAAYALWMGLHRERDLDGISVSTAKRLYEATINHATARRLVLVAVLVFGFFQLTWHAMARVASQIVQIPEKKNASSPDLEREAKDPNTLDFQMRCATAGVIVCEGFDNPSEFKPAVWPNSGVYPGGDGQFRVTMDTTVVASGNGSARFFIPANDTTTGPQVSGYWLQRMGRMFGAQSTFYVQYRFRMDTAMKSTDWSDPANGGSSPKMAIFHNIGATCGHEELTTSNGRGSGRPSVYTDCGSRALTVNPGTTNWKPLNPPYQYQNGYYNCAYPAVPTSPGGCFTMPANTWITYYYRVSLGDWGQPNSHITVWVAPEGQTLQTLVDVTKMALYQDGTREYDSVTLINYMSSFGQSQPPTNPASNSWYDELIISTSPIPAPAANRKGIPK